MRTDRKVSKCSHLFLYLIMMRNANMPLYTISASGDVFLGGVLPDTRSKHQSPA